MYHISFVIFYNEVMSVYAPSPAFVPQKIKV